MLLYIVLIFTIIIKHVRIEIISLIFLLNYLILASATTDIDKQTQELIQRLNLLIEKVKMSLKKVFVCMIRLIFQIIFIFQNITK